jgi:hypothetical protein
MLDRGEAQRRVHQIEAFRAEVGELAAAGVVALSPDQQQAVQAHHDALLQQYADRFDVDRSAAAGRLSLAMRLASFFAAATLTAALYSLVARVWGRLDFPLQATLLCLFPLASLVGVELSARRERTLYISSLFAVVAFGTFWLAAGVLSDLVNIPVTPFVIWAGVLFGVALALPYGFRIVLAGALTALVVAVAGSLFQSAGIPWTVAIDRLDLATVVSFGLLLLAPQLSRVDRSFGPPTRLTALVLGFSGLLVLSTFGDVSVLPLPTSTLRIIYQVLMLVACVAALVVGVRAHLTETIRVAATALSLFLLIRFVDWFWDVLPAYAFFFALAAVAFGWLLILRRIRARLARAQASARSPAAAGSVKA